MSAKTIHVALLGCGTVGTRVAELLVTQRNDIRRRTGYDLNLRRILVRDPLRRRSEHLDRSLFTSRPEDILDDGRIDLAVEVLGGIETARSLVTALLTRRVSVITANKSLLAHHGESLRRTAARAGCALAHEASVGGAIPLLNTLRVLHGQPVRSVRGIINGSCNFILTHMASTGVELDAALAEARSRGLVEPDPSADLTGRDAAEKLCVLAAALGRVLRSEQVELCGIESVTADDLRQARRWGFVLRSVAELDETGARVGPCLVPLRHWLADVRGERNAVAIQGAWSEELVLHGHGAGPGPTASAVIGDVINVLRGGWRGEIGVNSHHQHAWTARREPLKGSFVRLHRSSAAVSPDRILSSLEAEGIEIAQFECNRRTACFLTRPATARALDAALVRIGADRETTLIARQWTDEPTVNHSQPAFDAPEVAVVSAVA